MAHFGMLKKHKDMLSAKHDLREVMQRLYQQNRISEATVESIKAFSTDMQRM